MEIPTTLGPRLICVTFSVNRRFATEATDGKGTEGWLLRSLEKLKGAALTGYWQRRLPRSTSQTDVLHLPLLLLLPVSNLSLA